MMESKSYGILSKSISLWLYLLKLCSSSEKKNEVILDSKIHWYACGADGRRSLYGHVITKFSGMGRLP